MIFLQSFLFQSQFYKADKTKVNKLLAFISLLVTWESQVLFIKAVLNINGNEPWGFKQFLNGIITVTGQLNDSQLGKLSC